MEFIGRIVRHFCKKKSSTVSDCLEKYQIRYTFLRTKSVTKKQMNKCMTEIQGPGRI